MKNTALVLASLVLAAPVHATPEGEAYRAALIQQFTAAEEPTPPPAAIAQEVTQDFSGVQRVWRISGDGRATDSTVLSAVRLAAGALGLDERLSEVEIGVLAQRYLRRHAPLRAAVLARARGGETAPPPADARQAAVAATAAAFDGSAQRGDLASLRNENRFPSSVQQPQPQRPLPPLSDASINEAGSALMLATRPIDPIRSNALRSGRAVTYEDFVAAATFAQRQRENRTYAGSGFINPIANIGNLANWGGAARSFGQHSMDTPYLTERYHPELRPQEGPQRGILQGIGDAVTGPWRNYEPNQFRSDFLSELYRRTHDERFRYERDDARGALQMDSTMGLLNLTGAATLARLGAMGLVRVAAGSARNITEAQAFAAAADAEVSRLRGLVGRPGTGITQAELDAAIAQQAEARAAVARLQQGAAPRSLAAAQAAAENPETAALIARAGPALQREAAAAARAGFRVSSTPRGDIFVRMASPQDFVRYAEAVGVRGGERVMVTGLSGNAVEGFTQRCLDLFRRTLGGRRVNIITSHSAGGVDEAGRAIGAMDGNGMILGTSNLEWGPVSDRLVALFPDMNSYLLGQRLAAQSLLAAPGGPGSLTDVLGALVARPRAVPTIFQMEDIPVSIMKNNAPRLQNTLRMMRDNWRAFQRGEPLPHGEPITVASEPALRFDRAFMEAHREQLARMFPE